MNERHPPVLASDPRGETLELETEEMSDSSSSGHEEENLASGEVLAARYVLRAELGRGANSRVFRAYDLVTKTEIAIKCLPARVLVVGNRSSAWGVNCGWLGSDVICTFVTCTISRKGMTIGFLTMALATRGTLRHSLERTPERPWQERLDDARGLLSGLAALHADGIVHRDVKPENVLQMADGRLVLSDFGLAVAPARGTLTTDYRGAVGTLSYMAPEVLLDGEATMASDVFALGVVLHELLFDSRPAWLTTKRGRFAKPPQIQGGSRTLRAVARLCLDCLEQLAPRRPQTAGEVKRRFERAVLGRYGTIKGAQGRQMGDCCGAGARGGGGHDERRDYPVVEGGAAGDHRGLAARLVAETTAGRSPVRCHTLLLPVRRRQDGPAHLGGSAGGGPSRRR